MFRTPLLYSPIKFKRTTLPIKTEKLRDKHTVSTVIYFFVATFLRNKTVTRTDNNNSDIVSFILEIL